MRLLGILIYIFFCFNGLSQIENGSFEKWDSTENGYELPEHWGVMERYKDLIRFEKDSISTEGDFSLKIIPRGFSFNCPSRIEYTSSLNIATSGLKSLYFDRMSVSDNPEGNIFMKVLIIVWNNSGGILLDERYETVTKEFVRTEIPLNVEEIDSIYVEFMGGYRNGSDDRCDTRSFSWIDNVFIDRTGIVNVQSAKNTDISLYPNPSDGRFQVNSYDKSIKWFAIYDSKGMMLVERPFNNDHIYLEKPGIYFIKFISANGQSFVRKAIVN